LNASSDASDVTNENSAKPLVLCLVGTDHHPFDRVIGWCDTLADQHPEIRVLVQHGWSDPPRVADGQAFLEKAELVAALGEAHVAISHGGPGLISEVRDAGLLPIVVPRDPERGEHVDGHQQRFVARVAKSGIVDEVGSLEAFSAAIEGQLAQARGGLDVDADRGRVQASVAAFAALVDDVVKPRR
jgi:UDP-N-acetylglucosamine transferase subunit ALG13